MKVLPDGVLLSVNVQPRASQSGIGEQLGNELRVKVTEPPVDSAANKAVVRILAKILGVGRSQVELVRGKTSRHKVLKIRGLGSVAILAKLGKPS